MGRLGNMPPAGVVYMYTDIIKINLKGALCEDV